MGVFFFEREDPGKGKDKKKKKKKETKGKKRSEWREGKKKMLGGRGEGSDIFVCVSREKGKGSSLSFLESFSPLSLGVTLQFCSCCFSASLFGSTLKCV